MEPTSGIPHVTAIASNPQRNLDFYAEVLGLRLVERTLNFDDPGTYHFYFAHAAETPCTILTLFPWPCAARGHIGSGQVTVTSFSAPKQRSSCFADPDGLKVELVASVWNRESHVWGGAELRMDGPGDGIEVVFLSQ